jgi:hypothetical protein
MWKKIGKYAAITTVGILTLAGCADSGPTWQEEMRAELDEVFYEGGQDPEEFCQALAFFGVDTSEQMGAMLFTFAGDELPDRDTLVSEVSELAPDNDLLAKLPEDLTIGDVVDEAGAYILELCETE